MDFIAIKYNYLPEEERKKFYPTKCLQDTTTDIISTSDIESELNQVCPISAVTGYRTGDVVQLLDGNVSDSTKALISEHLQQYPHQEQLKGLSDADLVQFLPSRYGSSYADLSNMINYTREVISQMSDKNASDKNE